MFSNSLSKLKSRFEFRGIGPARSRAMRKRRDGLRWAIEPLEDRTLLSSLAGDLDPTFGDGGRVTTDFLDDNRAGDVAIQADGKIVAAGTSDASGTITTDFAVARYNPDGSLDASFGGNGKVTTDFFSGFDGAQGVAIQSDGKIVAAGLSQSDTGLDFALARYFAVTPEDAIEDIILDVQVLVTSGALNNGQGASLLIKLQGAIQQLDSDNEMAAISLLQAFVVQVGAFIEGGILTSAEGQPLIGAANAIIDQLRGSPLHVAGGRPQAGAGGPPLTQELLQPVVQQALAQWSADGADARRLSHLDIRIADIPGTRLGVVGSSGTIWIDRDAAGYGWSVNSGGVDLFSVVTQLLCATRAADPSPAQKKVSQAVTAKQVAVVQSQATKLAKAQRATAEKLVEAKKAVVEAGKALVEAQKSVAAARDESVKQAATKRVEEARQKLTKARKAAAKQLAALKKAVKKLRIALKKTDETVVFRLGFPGRGTLAVRENVDPEDMIERFLLLAPGGPLVVEVAMTLDGKPFRVAREMLIDEMLAIADKNKDGKPTWEDAIQNPHFTLGRYLRVANESQRARYIKNLDRNNNGLVNRSEVRQFLAQYFGGPAFTIGDDSNIYRNVSILNGRLYLRNGGQADLRKLLDTDNDGDLSVEEIAAATDRLKSRDADDNDLLEISELSGGAGVTSAARRRFVSRQQRRLAILLGPMAQSELLFNALHERYKNDEGHVVASSFSTMPKLFEQVDKNKNGRLDGNEVLGFNEVKPHIRLAVNFGKTDGPKGLSLKALAPMLQKSKESSREILLELPGVNLSFETNLTSLNTFGDNNQRERDAQSYLTRYDKDKNGYLDKKELPQNLQRQMGLWDADSDGKVYVKEITALYTWQLAPQNSQIRASVKILGNVLFEALDSNGDGRLGLREMKTSPQRLKIFDKNKDGKISLAEIPVTISVALVRGSGSYASLPRRSGVRTTSKQKNTNAPKWFTRMDRNGDGDVTLKEFLGTKEEFMKLDTNGDGFIEPKEAKAAKIP